MSLFRYIICVFFQGVYFHLMQRLWLLGYKDLLQSITFLLQSHASLGYVHFLQLQSAAILIF